ncbi:apolipoprotein D-like [Lucilia cuprina]|uniref:apolipoprotein D-like n=1 Tax=Lucilia cuprina TaxID=7375 RepID=UPI001F05666A|nr:apolipoprotein D-like [Lucilia cuprina]
MNKSSLTLAILSALLGLSAAQVVFQGSCPENVKVVSDFNVEKYLGKWYEYAKYPAYFEMEGKCVTALYSLSDDGNVTVKNTLINEKTNVLTDILGTASLVANGKLLVKFPVSPAITVSSNYWILDTDYDNYTVIYSCVPVTTNTHATIAWILTRQALPEPTIIEKAVSVLKENNVSLREMTITNQISCNEETA